MTRTGSVVADVLIDVLSGAQDSTAPKARKRFSGPGKGKGKLLASEIRDLERGIQYARQALVALTAAAESGAPPWRLADMLIAPRSDIGLAVRFLEEVDEGLANRKRGGR